MTRHVVMFSGGLGSWMTARRVAAEHGTDNLVLLFADVAANSDNPNIGEDEDTYRFVHEAAANVGGELVVVADGRDIWQVFKDDRFLGNSRLANCSKYLKQIPCRTWLDENCDPADTIVYVGIDWSESHRVAAIEKSYLPFVAKAPLTEPPYVDRDDMMAACRAAGMEIPRLYLASFSHGNCGGGCVRGGQAQFELLLREHPERYAEWERQEQGLRDHLDKDVSILKDRTKGTTTPLTLRKFREGIEAQTMLFDPNDFGGCGCFVDSEEPANEPTDQEADDHDPHQCLECDEQAAYCQAVFDGAERVRYVVPNVDSKEVAMSEIDLPQPPQMVRLCGYHSRELGPELIADGLAVYTGPDCEHEGCGGE